jgi:hypothetical protein
MEVVSMVMLGRLIALIGVVAALAACGGGGGAGGGSVTPSTSGATISYSITSAVINQSILLTPTVTGAPGGVKSFAVSSGALPGGMVFNSATGEISGTPTALGSYPLTITLAVSGATGSVSSGFTLQVVNPAITGTLSYSSPSLIRGTASTINPSVSGMPTGTSYTAINLPTGLSINASTGVISGTASSAGSFDITVTATVTNFSGSLQAHVIGTISDPAISTLGATISYSTPNTVTRSGGNSSPSPVSISPTLSGIPGGASPNYTLASGSLPTGLSLNASSGVISGTTSVAPGNYNFAVSLSISGFSGTDTSNSTTITVSNPANYIDWSQVSASTPFFYPLGSTANANGAQMTSIGADLYVVKTNAFNGGTYTYKSSDNGATWTLINTDTSMNFSNFALTSYGTNLVMLGGSSGLVTLTYNTKVRTLDVSTATPTTAWSLGATPPFSNLQEHAVVKQGSSYYVLGGYTGIGFSNSVYTSTDAQTWSAVTVTTPFSARSMHCAFSDGANLYVYGGESSGGTNAVLNKDLLKSADLGVTWTQVIADVGTTGALYPTCGYVNGNIVIAMGGSLTTGYSATTFTNTVRSSSNGGVSWTSAPAVPATYTNSSYYSAAFTVLNNVLYVTLGEDASSVYGGVWKISP